MTFIALLRAVNVGGTGKLPMGDLTAICEAAGLASVRTYIASGNVVFDSRETETVVKARLESALLAYAGKPVGVIIRTGGEMAAALTANPFAAAAANRTVAIFLNTAPPADALDRATGRAGEEIALGLREIYVHYPDGQASTKLRLPAAATGTARNMNTVAKLAQMAAGSG